MKWLWGVFHNFVHLETLYHLNLLMSGHKLLFEFLKNCEHGHTMDLRI
jgi:hypothetical protein